MGKALDDPARPFVAVLGGAKVSDKIGVINNLLDKADTVIIGGGMAYTFIKAMGHGIGNSLLEADKLDYALEMIEKAKKKNVRLLLPVDTAIGNEFKADCEKKIVPVDAIPDGWMGLDIGPETVKLFSDAIKSAKTVVWNGPMGVFEFEAFADGTRPSQRRWQSPARSPSSAAAPPSNSSKAASSPALHVCWINKK